MKMLSALRSVDVEDSPGNSQERLTYLGYHIQHELFLPAKNYLRIHVEFADQSQLHGFIDVAAWLTRSVPSVEGIDWLSLDEQIIYSFIPVYPLVLELDNQHAPIVKSTIVEVVNDVSRFVDYPRIATSTGVVLIEQFLYGQALDNSDLPVVREMENSLVSKIDFVIGYSKLPLSALTTIEVGDVLLVSVVQEFVMCGKKSLFRYNLDRESIVITGPAETAEHSSEIKGGVKMHSEDKINDLPIELSFVLMEKTVTLAELKSMAPGEVVTLPPDQAMQIEIRANQRSYFRGELVQLSNGQLAVEIRQIAN